MIVGTPVEHIDQEAHAHGNGPAPEFGEVDAREQAQRDAEERGQADQDQRSLDGMGRGPRPALHWAWGSW